MNDVREILAAGRSGVHRSVATAEQVRAAADEQGWAMLQLDTDGLSSKTEFLAAAARDLQLPDWFGRNWDAFADALSDLGAQRPTLVVWSGRRGLEQDVRITATEILTERVEQAAEMSEARSAFVVLLLEG